MARRGPGDARADLPARDAGRRATPPSILVVDDDPDVRDLVERILRRAGADVVAVADGRSALRLIADGIAQPTILLTDIDMPGMNGIELSARVRAMRPGVDIVLMTGDPSSAEAARERPDLVRVALLKPVSVAELLAAMGLVPQESTSERAPG
jgi:CheY-like chemotaxis protein